MAQKADNYAEPESSRGEAGWIQNFSFFSGKQAQRVAVMCYLLALKAGLSREDADLLRLVAPIRKVPEGWRPQEMNASENRRPGNGGTGPDRRYASAGLDIFNTSDDDILRAALLVAEGRHEHWDGSGRPAGRKAEEIHIFGRIAAIVHMFESLTRWHSDGRPFDPEQVAALIRKQRGRRLDPRLVDIFLRSLDEFLAIARRYPAEGQTRTNRTNDSSDEG